MHQIEGCEWLRGATSHLVAKKLIRKFSFSALKYNLHLFTTYCKHACSDRKHFV